MTNASKGVLLSALVLPGLGQFILKRKMRGSLLMIAILALLGALMVQIINAALTALQNINIPVEQIDFNVLYDTVLQASTGSGTLLASILLLCWLGATIDAYLIGKELDRGDFIQEK